MVPADRAGLDGVAAARAVAAGEVSSVDLVEDALARVEALDGPLNAFTVTFPHEARAAARQAARAVADGRPLGALHGVPVSVKDHIWMAGAPATNGSLAYAGFVPDEDCAAVARLRAAGAIVVGKTNNPEFCYRGFTDNAVYGLTRNPWDVGRTPGGSSGGAGASVAAGMVGLAVGTDGGGSIRIPASFCGVVGHKPTFGLVPKEPGFRGWKTLSVDGPITRTVRDAALMLGVMAGPSAADDMSYPGPDVDYVAAAERADLAGLRIAYSADLGFAPVEPWVRSAFADAVDVFARAGCKLVEAHPPTEPPAELWNVIATCEGWASEGPLLVEWEHAMSPGIAALVRAGEGVTAGEYVDAQHRRAAYTRAWAGFFGDHDLLLTPTMQVSPLPVGVASPAAIDGQPVDPFFDDWCSLSLPANLTGMPAASVPCGRDPDGLPIGLQVMGPRFEDARVLAAAAAFERLAPWPRWTPPATR